MRREGSTAGKEAAESRAGSLRSYAGNSCSSCGDGGGHLRAARGTGPSPESGPEKGTVCRKQKRLYCYVSSIPWWPPGARCKCLRGIISRIFPGAASECEGIQTSGLAWPLQPGSPTPHPHPCLFPPLLTNICSAGYTTLGWRSRWNIAVHHPEDTHSPWTKVDTSSCVLDSFPFLLAAVTNDHKWNSLTQQVYSLQFRRSEV